MKLEELAVRVLEAAEAENVEFMAVGAIAAGAYGVPRSTRTSHHAATAKRFFRVKPVIPLQP
jgi:O-acetyl-ADP-ribose deacetylase (regulator of RNase III)